MVVQVYKFPEGLTPEELINILSSVQTNIKINPIQDIDDNWIISKEEWNEPKWQDFKKEYIELTSLFTLIDFKEKPSPI
jgi:hypothetical protein